VEKVFSYIGASRKLLKEINESVLEQEEDLGAWIFE
jgi:hypothetical protein